jgi:hypothetical protein
MIKISTSSLKKQFSISKTFSIQCTLNILRPHSLPVSKWGDPRDRRGGQRRRSGPTVNVNQLKSHFSDAIDWSLSQSSAEVGCAQRERR